MREIRLEAARKGRHGLQIMTFEQLAARLAGGFARPIDDASLRAAIQSALPTTTLGELNSIKLLPGMVDAAADTLHKAWRAGIDLKARSAQHPRLAAVAQLEEAVVAQLPPSMITPVALVAAAMPRLKHAASLLGSVDIVGITELSPCWRPLLEAVATHTPVQWIAGPRPVPSWLELSAVAKVRSEKLTPEMSVVSASTSYHEAIEAVRWARGLLAAGLAQPADIARGHNGDVVD